MKINRILFLLAIMMPAHQASAQEISIVTHENALAKSDIPDWLNKFLKARWELQAKEQEMKEIKKRNKKLFK